MEALRLQRGVAFLDAAWSSNGRGSGGIAPVKKNSPRSASAVDAQIGARIRARRSQIAMSQETLAAKIGVTFQQVQKYEKGVNRVSAATLLDIAEVLDIALMALLPKAQADPGSRSLFDDEAVDLAQRFAKLNVNGRRILLGLADALTRDELLRHRR